jgi:hypothetical protein
MPGAHLLGKKFLTVKQPYAGLIASGYKTLETRSWSTPYRGELYIHAGMGVDQEAMTNYDIDKENYPQHINALVPMRGVVLCKVTLKDVIPQDAVQWEMLSYSTIEKEYGYWHEGHYAWVLSDPVLVEPYEVRGQLGLWTLK